MSKNTKAGQHTAGLPERLESHYLAFTTAYYAALDDGQTELDDLATRLELARRYNAHAGLVEALREMLEYAPTVEYLTGSCRDDGKARRTDLQSTDLALLKAQQALKSATEG